MTEIIFQEQCHTAYATEYDTQCHTEYKTEYETVYEEKCSTKYVDKCETQYEQQCSTSYAQVIPTTPVAMQLLVHCRNARPNTNKNAPHHTRRSARKPFPSTTLVTVHRAILLLSASR